MCQIAYDDRGDKATQSAAATVRNGAGSQVEPRFCPCDEADRTLRGPFTSIYAVKKIHKTQGVPVHATKAYRGSRV